MSFKDYFSSDSWFNGAQGHLLNMALKDYNDKGAKRYIVKEYFMSGVGVFCGAIIYGISSMIGKINLKTFSSFVVSLWDHTVGLLFNSVSDDNSAADTAPPNAKLADNTDTTNEFNNTHSTVLEIDDTTTNLQDQDEQFIVSVWENPTKELVFNSISDDNSAADTAPPSAKLAGNADTY